MEKSMKSAFFGDKELSREFITSRTVSDVENFVKKMSSSGKSDEHSRELRASYHTHWSYERSRRYAFSAKTSTNRRKVRASFICASFQMRAGAVTRSRDVAHEAFVAASLKASAAAW